jgi:hypothetical protein
VILDEVTFRKAVAMKIVSNEILIDPDLFCRKPVVAQS